MQHYAQITEADMKEAATKTVLEIAEKSVQKSVLTTAATADLSSKEPQEEKQNNSQKPLICNDLQQKERACESLRNAGSCLPVGRAGPELSEMELSQLFESIDTYDYFTEADKMCLVQNRVQIENVKKIMDSWGILPEHIQRAIMALMDSTGVFNG